MARVHAEREGPPEAVRLLRAAERAPPLGDVALVLLLVPHDGLAVARAQLRRVVRVALQRDVRDPRPAVVRVRDRVRIRVRVRDRVRVRVRVRR